MSLLVLCVTGGGAVAQSVGPQLRVLRTEWGFANHVRPGTFTPVNLLISNNGQTGFDGVLSLSQKEGIRDIDIPIRSRVYVGPGEQRWVQFYPYRRSVWESWELSWRDAAGRRSVDLMGESIRNEDRVYVFIEARPNYARQPHRHLLSFEQERFPLTVGATHGLDGVLIAEAPQWQALQRRAFRDWVYSGGQVHLVQLDTGEFDRFEDELAFLNLPAERAQYGTGTITRHEFERDAFTRAHYEDDPVSPNDLNANLYDNPPEYGSAPEDVAFRNLRNMVRPDHPWGVIFMCGVVFVVLVGPINWLLGRKVDYRLAPLFMLLVVGGTSWLFWELGKQGYRQASNVHTMTFARKLPDDRLELSQMSNIFTVDRGRLVVTHDGEFDLYSTWFEAERVPGEIFTGDGGGLATSLPVFSNRDVYHNGVVRAATRNFDVDFTFEEDGELAVHTPANALGVWTVSRDQHTPLALRESANNVWSTRNARPESEDSHGLPYWYMDHQVAPATESERDDRMVSLVQSILQTQSQLGVTVVDEDRPRASASQDAHVALVLLREQPDEPVGRMTVLDGETGAPRSLLENNYVLYFVPVPQQDTP